MAQPPSTRSSTIISSVFDDDYDTTIPLQPQFTLIQNHPDHPFGSMKPPRLISFTFTPERTRTPLIASVTQYDTQTHIHLTETGMFTSHLRVQMNDLSSMAGETFESIDTAHTNQQARSAISLSSEPLQGQHFFATDMLCQKIAELIITPSTPVLFSISLTNVLGLKKHLKNQGFDGDHDDDDDDDFGDINNDKMLIMKDIVSQFAARLVVE